MIGPTRILAKELPRRERLWLILEAHTEMVQAAARGMPKAAACFRERILELGGIAEDDLGQPKTKTSGALRAAWQRCTRLLAWNGGK